VYTAATLSSRATLSQPRRSPPPPTTTYSHVIHRRSCSADRCYTTTPKRVYTPLRRKCVYDAHATYNCDFHDIIMSYCTRRTHMRRELYYIVRDGHPRIPQRPHCWIFCAVFFSVWNRFRIVLFFYFFVIFLSDAIYILLHKWIETRPRPDRVYPIDKYCYIDIAA